MPTTADPDPKRIFEDFRYHFAMRTLRSLNDRTLEEELALRVLGVLVVTLLHRPDPALE